MSNSKVKTFRIKPATQYKLTKLKEQWGISEGKTIERLIDSTYYKLFENHQQKRELTNDEKELIKIANTEWVEKF